jgi:hypothetical protein
MKKMNLYFNVSRYFALLLPCFMLLGSMNLMADNGKKNLGKKTALVPTTKFSMVAIDATISSTPVINCPAPNTTLGSVTVTVNSTPGYLAPTLLRTTIWSVSPLGIVARVSSAFPPVFPFVVTSGTALPAGDYTARVEVIDAASGLTVEASDYATTVGSGPANVAPAFTATAPAMGSTRNVQGCGPGTTVVTPAMLGFNAASVSDDCGTPIVTVTAGNPVPYNVSTPVTVTVTDAAGLSVVEILLYLLYQTVLLPSLM